MHFADDLVRDRVAKATHLFSYRNSIKDILRFYTFSSKFAALQLKT